MSMACVTAMDKITWSFMILGVYVQLCACLMQSSQWIKDTGSSGIVCPSDAIRSKHVHSPIQCGGLCDRDVGCESFTFTLVNTTAPNCFLMNEDPSLLTTCYSDTTAKHYLQLHANFRCQTDDRNYHTYKLSDGSFLSYRIVHVLTDAITARADCMASGGSLLKASTIAKLTFIQKWFKTCTGYYGQYYYIEGNNDNVDGVWTWDDGEPIIRNSTFWVNGQPDNSAQHCVVMNSHSNWQFHDAYCHDNFLRLCEKNL